jgi:8-amino-7-oxononanoate synthase
MISADRRRHRPIFTKELARTRFNTNDYLGLATHPKVIAAFQQAAAEYGLGSGASPIVSGYSTLHHALEEAFAAFLKRDRAILFNSGYHANLGVITTFANRRTTIVADKYIHASLIDGMVLSRAKHQRYQHHDLVHADQLLSQIQNERTLFVTESVFSITGHLTDIEHCATLAKKHRTKLIVDDAHGIGVLGQAGSGIANQDATLNQAITCLITPLGKAMGSMGAMVSGTHEVIEEIIQSARSYWYSTALPPAICAGTLASLNVLQTEPWRQAKLQALIRHFNQAAKERALPLITDDPTPIRSLVIGDNMLALALQSKLHHLGYDLACIRPPTIPLHQACLRCSLTVHHEEEDITRLLDHLVTLIKNRHDHYI